MREEQGLLIKGLGGLYEVSAPSGHYTCRALGNLKRGDEKLLVGDVVSLRIDDSERGETVITSHAPRQNALIRPPLANLKLMLLTVAPASPDPLYSLIDRMTVICEREGILPAVLVTKKDLDPQGAERMAELYRKVGYDTFVLSSLTGEGAQQVHAYLSEKMTPDTVACFAGVSGVGKSSLMNLLFPDLGQQTGDISEKTGRGRHTTRHVELFPCYRGWLADTPGFSLLDFLRYDFVFLEELPTCFPEIAPHVGQCRYGDCTHVKEEGCAVRQAVADGQIAQSRYQSYAELYAILREKQKNRFSK